jgi:hypothetical protein
MKPIFRHLFRHIRRSYINIFTKERFIYTATYRLNMAKLGSDWLYIGLGAAAIYAAWKISQNLTGGIGKLGDAIGNAGTGVSTAFTSGLGGLTTFNQGITAAEKQLFLDFANLYSTGKTEVKEVGSDTIDWLAKIMNKFGGGQTTPQPKPTLYKSGVDFYNTAIPGVNYTAQVGDKAPNFSSITGAQLYIAPPPSSSRVSGAPVGTIFKSGASVKSTGASGKYRKY